MAAVPRQAFAASAERPAALIERLRRTLGAAEASTGLAGEDGALLALGIPSIDGALGGGLSSGTLHEIAAARETETTAATGFALALALAACRPLSLRGAARARNDEESFLEETSSGSPRISRSPRMACPMAPVSTRPASLPSS